MAATANGAKANGRRRKLLDLAPLELACMNCLWPLGEATVRQIRDELAAVRPRAYTTIMTIMDRLTHKGIVTRRRAGKAYLYCPNLSAEDARARAVAQVVEHFFGGSSAALAAHLGLREVQAHPRREREWEVKKPAASSPSLGVPAAESEPSGQAPKLDDILL